MPPVKSSAKKMFLCTICGASGSTSQNLKQHIDHNHLGIRHVCLSCSMLCGQSKEFYRHRIVCVKNPSDPEEVKKIKPLLVIFNPGQEPVHVPGHERHLLRNFSSGIWKKYFDQPDYKITWLDQPINCDQVKAEVPVQEVVKPKTVLNSTKVKQPKLQSGKAVTPIG